MEEAVIDANKAGENSSKVAFKILTSKLELTGYDGIRYNDAGKGAGTAWTAFRSN